MTKNLFAIAARVSAGIKKEALSLDEKHWHPIYQEDADGNKLKMTVFVLF
jgi:hypothetical protein